MLDVRFYFWVLSPKSFSCIINLSSLTLDLSVYKYSQPLAWIIKHASKQLMAFVFASPLLVTLFFSFLLFYNRLTANYYFLMIYSALKETDPLPTPSFNHLVNEKNSYRIQLHLQSCSKFCLILSFKYSIQGAFSLCDTSVQPPSEPPIHFPTIGHPHEGNFSQ